VIREAIEAGASVEEIFLVEDGAGADFIRLAADRGIATTVVSEPVMAAISDTSSPQGAVALVREEPAVLEDVLAGADLIVVLAQVRDPGNAGSLVRSAVAAGASAVVFTRGSVDPFHPKTVRAASGALFRVPIVRGATVPAVIAALKIARIQVLGAASDASTPADDLDLTGPVALVLGNEAWGLPPEDRSLVDRVVGIPMPGPAESLNVGIAGSVLLFEVVRQRRGGEEDPAVYPQQPHG
jgi:TrmH family RNA methyltransferase